MSVCVIELPKIVFSQKHHCCHPQCQQMNEYDVIIYNKIILSCIHTKLKSNVVKS